MVSRPKKVSLKLYFCPTCTRVYYLSEEAAYLCGRNHATAVWEDGRLRRFVISNRDETNKPPWPIPALSEEREILNQDFIESWIDACPNPEDTEFGDFRRHFGYGAPGGRHLTRDQVLAKYSSFVLRPVE